MKHVCQILLLLMPLFCRSQQRTIDSLKRLLATATTDSARYKLADNIVYNYRFTRYDSALYYTGKALLLAQKNGKKLNEAQALTYKGFLLNRLQRLTESFQTLSAALQIAENPQNENSFWNTRKPEVKDKDYRLSTLASIHNRLGIFMENVGRTDQATFHYREAIKFFRVVGDSSGVALINTNLGAMYWKRLNKPDSALLFAKAAESIFARRKVAGSGLGLAYAVMGASYLAIDNNSRGVASMYDAISISKKYNTRDILVYSYRILADFYVQEKNKDSALYYAQMAANIHIPINTMDLGDDFENLARSYELNQKLDSAYKYQAIALSTYDSIYKNRIKGLIGFQQLSFDQQKQLQQLEADKKDVQNRISFYTLFGGLSLTILVSFFLYRNNRQRKKAYALLKEQKEELEKQRREAQIEAALERVRSRTMAMQKSEELKEVIQLVLDQLCELNFHIDSASFAVELRESDDLRIWVAVPGHQYASQINLPYIDHLIFNRFVQAKEKREHFYALTCTKEEKDRWFDHFFKYVALTAERRKAVYSRTGWSQLSVLMETVALNVQNYSGISYSQEQNDTLLRFGKVFGQSYTRFLDLQKAEAQAREAQIEAALERVRARTMAMQKSEELREVIQLIQDQLFGLHFNTDSASFTIELNESNDMRIWVAAPGQQYAAKINLPYINHPIFNLLMEAKGKREHFFYTHLSKGRER
jgi:hypothetical protein